MAKRRLDLELSAQVAAKFPRQKSFETGFLFYSSTTNEFLGVFREVSTAEIFRNWIFVL